MNKIFRFLVGVVFLLSALLKAIDTAAFADLMGQYGFAWLGFGAPMLIFLEYAIGVLLIFDIYPRIISIIAACFLCAVSLIYLYGVVAIGITDCGCFGPLTWLNTKPWLTFTRNAILLTFLIPSMLQPQQGSQLTTAAVLFMAIIGIVIMFMCGFSLRGAKCLKTEQNTFEPIPLSESKLSDFVSCNPDSIYFVFAFSYTCPFCQNSIGNVNQYQQMGYVDKVIGLAVEDSVARSRFKQIFDVNFEIKELPALQMYRLATTLPTSFLIRHDTVVNYYTGMVISPALLIP